jgi:hypothetical protein
MVANRGGTVKTARPYTTDARIDKLFFVEVEHYRQCQKSRTWILESAIKISSEFEPLRDDRPCPE